MIKLKIYKQFSVVASVLGGKLKEGVILVNLGKDVVRGADSILRQAHSLKKLRLFETN